MYVPSNSPKYVCTSCRNEIPIVDLETLFREGLQNYLVSREKIAKYLNNANKEISEKTRLLESL